MNSMTSAVPVANSVLVVAPHNGYPATPGIMSQVPLYPNNQPQVHLVPGNPPGLMSNVNRQPVQKTLKEGKTLGAIQIIIGLAHIGLGSIMGTVLVGDYLSISFYGGFPFWGGLWVSVMYPNVYAANPVVIPEPVTSPPSYSSEFQANK
ncbi:membrane-spanning 4-domains subfamily A member 8 isoform X4 [Macaca fascicularis]|uniref:membrane-spanning 4-domains subfamily A member 8 isoform X4 n=1 Tax=Macaca fascicularis TaxID=9541 RepID=UPI003D15A033